MTFLNVVGNATAYLAEFNSWHPADQLLFDVVVAQPLDLSVDKDTEKQGYL
jgi:hypothetical protein